MGKIITMVSHKGGCAKTTTAANLGGILSRGFDGHGPLKVLLVDLDAQMNLTNTFTSGEFPSTVSDAFWSFLGGRKEQRMDLPVYGIHENLDIAPASEDLCRMDSTFSGTVGRDKMLHNMLKGVRDRYDVIIIDTPAQMGLPTVNALAAADSYIIPINCDAYSLSGLEQVDQIVEAIKESDNEDLTCEGVLITRFHPKQLVDEKTEANIRQTFGDLVYRTVIRECACVRKAPFVKTDIVDFDARSNGAVDYLGFAEEFANNLG